MSTPISISGNADFSARLDYVLRGRKPHPWGAALGLKPATITRFRNGLFPDPVKLMPACRTENLSLSWLLFGIGTPYLVQTVADAGEAIDRIEQLLADELWNILIVECKSAWLPVLYQPGDLTLPDGKILDYRMVQVITGNLVGAEARLADILDAMPGGVAELATLADADWRRLATGYMGTVELFGGDYRRDLRTSDFKFDFTTSPLNLREGSSPYGSYTAAEREALDIVRNLERGDRDAALRMLRGLALKPQP